MFTLDDSGSMQSDAIPDYAVSGASYSGMPNDDNSLYFRGARQFSYPNMWGSGSGYLSTSLYRSTNAIARYMRSSAGNPLYYDRTVTYRPWPQAANNSALNTNANPAAVNVHTDSPFNTSRQLNLNTRQGGGGADNEANNYWLGTYYIYTGATPMPLARPNNALNVVGNFTKVEIKSSVATYFRAASRSDCSGAVGADGCTYAEERQNFANWLQYYRNRRLMAKGGVAAAFAKQGTNVRVGYTEISNDSDTPLLGIRQFTGADRTSFFTTMYGAGGLGTTPLRRAMDRVGRYFSSTGVNNPWAQTPGTTTGTEYSCRRSFHILSTDGYWTDGGGEDAVNSSVRANNDSYLGSTPAKPDGTTYTYGNGITPTADPLVGRFTVDPFKDGNSVSSNTLADVAAYYWKNDLRTDIPNRVPPSTRDPAFWQHLTTYTVGLGINGTGLVTKASDGSIADLTTPSSRDALVASKTALNWTVPVGNGPTTGDDLIHAAMNGRGQYFSVTNPSEMANELNKALSEVTDQSYDLASAAADSPQVRAGSRLYQSTYSPAQWYGRLYAFEQQLTGLVNNRPTTASYANPDQAWEASNKMPAPASRNIYTYNAQVGSPRGRAFTWANLNNAQQSYLVGLSAPATLSAAQVTEGQLRIDYLRGSATSEVASGGIFRDRSRYTVAGVTGGVLGDVVNGSPVKGPDAGGGYDRLPSADPAAAAYSAFRSGTTLDNMRNSIFLGANDGMLHAFNLTDGVERFAYVPNSVYNVPRSTSAAAPGIAEQKLKMLSDTTYTHRFTVDGPPNVGDAYIGGWKTILAASTGAGARSVFAMDVTNPVVVSGGFDQNKIMWEFSEADHSGMGFVTGYPHIARMRDGSWAAIFGNGYDSTGGQARLFILDLATGAVIREFAVGGTAGDNGLSQPNFIVNTNREVTTIYAGDLKGNLWKFDVSDTVAANWHVAYGTGPNYTPLFTTGTNQPISVMPEITAHTDAAGGAMITFGTGKLFEASDTASSGNVNLSTQALYGVWDKPSDTTGGLTSASLLQQTAPTIVDPAIYGSTTAAAPNWATQRGWFMNLASGGERVNLAPQQVKSVMFMVANTPIVDPCANGGKARIFVLDPVTGSVPSFGVFDTNGDGQFDSSDNASYNVRQISSGLLTQPLFQLPAQTAYAAPIGSTLSPFPLFDRGQSSAARGGGVELARSGGGTLGPGTVTNECALLMTAAQSNTALMSQYINTCLKPPSTVKPRISWRQLH
jgi:type IV pilus assembly protein PilY1